ncbi:MAG: 2-C-methyl-D-erythritol 2,4-cyclodiphosphate synthase [Firmicutes bacterium]|uniref:2-C-methyl-D-erythritol 2,4-cyclodiphosphate synthase n=1 Tax=Melghirimyces thermohalophilus TaxID=1236220 RepID=A0A1G6PC44_9BACL|nr:2-C-methyl-D-erythritol 2,4-cyclodiphosphate synthase [Melghirimyces thermohalophilus]MDA8353453.1 2-C-methyl-D-erythritol 2,4-cyclodiphosphate synthase [Bacillota bacterium]SDC77578.1 2-C-methyl-D-erythritol 2,4-cyclodiphosphate synthase [Melghirimyces thermohalophilus]
MIRVGQGFDVHQFADDRPLILGGIEIPHSRGLSGHSDADVLLHAITDAVLGALGKGDIGTHFPDTDPEYEGADSAKLLREVWLMAEREGFSLGNLDATVIAQKPKMVPYIQQIRERVAGLLHGELSNINIKATTTEHLGFAGREEGIAAMAVVCLVSPGK